MNMSTTSANGSRASSGVSRLAMMQARFQAQQLMEREQKLIHILEERQEEAIRRIAYSNRDSVHSANSLSSTNSNSGSSYNSNRSNTANPHFNNRSIGARSADLHTSPIGWDKSYPLRPMNDPGLPEPPTVPRTPSMGLYKRNSTSEFDDMNDPGLPPSDLPKLSRTPSKRLYKRKSASEYDNDPGLPPSEIRTVPRTPSMSRFKRNSTSEYDNDTGYSSQSTMPRTPSMSRLKRNSTSEYDNDPGLPPAELPTAPRTPSMGLYKRNSTVGLSNLSGNKYSGGYGPKGQYVTRNRGLSLDRLQGNGFSNGNSLQTSPTRRPSYGLTRTRSQAHILGHSSGEDSYGSSSRPPSTYEAYNRHEVNLNRSNTQLYGSRNGNLHQVSATNDFLDSPPSPPGSRKTSYTREYVRNLPTTVSGHSAPATRGRLTRRSQSSIRGGQDVYDHSSYSSQSSDKSENGTNGYHHPGIVDKAVPVQATEKIIPVVASSSSTAAIVREPSYERKANVIDGYSYESRPRINSQTFRKSRSPGKRQSRSPSRSPGRSTFASDENDRVNNNDGNSNFMQKSAVREHREEEKRRLQAEMRRREQELLAKIKEQQRELETMKQEKGKVERELHRQELMRERERKMVDEFKGGKANSFKGTQPTPNSQRPPPMTKRQIAVSRSSSSATSSSASKPDPDDCEDLDEDLNNQNRLRSIPQRPPPIQKSKTYINNDTPKIGRKLTSQSPAPNRRAYESPAPNRRNIESPAPNRRALSRPRAKDPSPAAANKGRGEPLTLSSLRAAAGNSQPPQPRPQQTPSTNRKSNNATNNKKPVNKAPPVRSRLAPKPRDDLTQCANCGRNFAEDRIEKHQEICIKTSKKKRKTFDMTKKRLEGTDAENFALRKGGRRRGGGAAASSMASSQHQDAPKKKSDWRKKRAEFIAALRAAKEAQRHLAAGGKVSDLPPPPRSDTSDYIQCPHCSRRFNQGAAERHIPKCKDIKSNKRR